MVSLWVLLVLTACSTTSSGRNPPPDPCQRLTVTPGSGPIAWSVAATGERDQVDSAPVAVGDGFLVSAGDPASPACIGFVESSGRLRWTIPGRLVDAVRVDDLLVVATGGRPSTIGVHAVTGATLWERDDLAIWQDLAVQGGTVMVAGTSPKGSVVTIEARTGRTVASAVPTSAAYGWFEKVETGDGMLVSAGTADTRGRVLVADAAGQIVLDAPVGLLAPNPVAVVGDVVIVQASGNAVGSDTGEPTTHLRGLDRASALERWHSVLPGPSAGRAVEVAGVVVVRLGDGLTGLDARSGVIRWRLPLAGTVESPVLAVGRDAVAVGAEDGEVVLVDAVDGRRRWSARTEGPVATLGAFDGDLLVVASAPGHFRTLRVADGTTQWTVRGPETVAGVISSDHDRVVTVAGDVAATLTSSTGIVALRRQP